MSHSFQAEADVLVMDARDHVATALRNVEAGETVRSRNHESVDKLVVQRLLQLDAVPFRHKVAIVKIEGK
ncbi:hypothetical protein [Paenibacillus xerothermodurans]|uniref:SAF domain-containing protein n=1 Tax=Paenibacillus xerothermodurans TaxID=1977292 RepID=A0A2W1NCV9_PAEXE|nr:hypothetical protein [Paenibacillus xerothermodurans]PZE22337.1 hypothetical protein CBW46_000660 [Paenibacillus xerothermodurans]